MIEDMYPFGSSLNEYLFNLLICTIITISNLDQSILANASMIVQSTGSGNNILSDTSNLNKKSTAVKHSVF